MNNLAVLFSTSVIMDCYYFNWKNSENKRFRRQLVVSQNYKINDLVEYLNKHIHDSVISCSEVEQVICIITQSDIENYDKHMHGKVNFIDKYWRDMRQYIVEGTVIVNNQKEEFYVQCIAPIDIKISEIKERIFNLCKQNIKIDQVSSYEDCWLKRI